MCANRGATSRSEHTATLTYVSTLAHFTAISQSSSRQDGAEASADLVCGKARRLIQTWNCQVIWLIKFAPGLKMDEFVATAASLLLCAVSYYNYQFIKCTKKRKRKSRRRWWMTSIHRNRSNACMEKQLGELVAEPSGEFKKFTRMSVMDFEYLLTKISSQISKQDTHLRKSIPARIRLAVTLRYLATGDDYQSLHFLFKISPQLISEIIPEVCMALNEALKDEIKLPSCPEEWLEISKGYSLKFPRAIGALDGKHVALQCPINSASEYFNYKRTFSIVLLALVDSQCNFTFADIGCQGRISDGGVFRNCMLWEKICDNQLNLPPPHPLPGLNKHVPYVFLADAAFALSENVMKPYPGNLERGNPRRIFNQRLSSARVTVENAFGILVTKFRVFKKPIQLQPEKASIVTLTCILLHNYLRRSRTSSHIYTPPGSIDQYDRNDVLIQPGSWRNETDTTCAVRNMRQIPRRSPLNATQIRDEFTTYCIR
ncbi:uncharacterized protein LOC134663896 [Cydia fagiglandana]|uniref:uncharacterized protein LOC134663896 n=1 Tax=Cydia fagiglandana TaxID=1458189 RepID=UPI002FEE056F